MSRKLAQSEQGLVRIDGRLEFGDRFQVADHHRCGLAQLSPRIHRTIGAASVQHDYLVTLTDEQLCASESQAARGARNEDA
jgi:hypothetical protein